VHFGEVILVVAGEVIAVDIITGIATGGVGEAVVTTTTGRLTPGPEAGGSPARIGVHVPLILDGGAGNTLVINFIAGLSGAGVAAWLALASDTGLDAVAEVTIIAV
jgi:hypothetical protein